MEYRHFLGPHDAELCILLDGSPGTALITYVEEILGFCILWVENGSLFGGMKTILGLPGLQIASVGR